MSHEFFFNCNIKKNKIIKSNYILKKNTNNKNFFVINSRLKSLISANRVKARYNLVNGEPFCLSKIIIND